jgi:hypothetical protein
MDIELSVMEHSVARATKPVALLCFRNHKSKAVTTLADAASTFQGLRGSATTRRSPNSESVL